MSETTDVVKMPEADLHVTVKLHEVKHNDAIPTRTIVLSGPSWELQVGRGTLSGDVNLKPASNNAWFDSRVMSRNHATIRAKPETREITVEDAGSMHGTHVGGKKLGTRSERPLHDKDVIIFGADVTRGNSFFQAMHVMISYHWSDEESTDSSRPASANKPRNSFTADYNSDDEISENSFNDTDDSVGQPSVEDSPPARAFTVPDSDISDAQSDSSDVIIVEPESSNSSPLVPNIENDNVEVVSITKLRPLSPNQEIEAQADLESDRSSQYSTRNEPDYLDGQQRSNFHISNQDQIATNIEHDLPEPHTNFETSSPIVPISNTSAVHAQSTQYRLAPPDSEWSVRTPSPSDAAMAKRSVQELHSLPYYRPQLGSPDYYWPAVYDGATFTPDQGRTEGSWAGHNSVLYEPLSPNFAPYSAASETWNSNSSIYSPVSVSKTSKNRNNGDPTTPLSPVFLSDTPVLGLKPIKEISSPKTGSKRKASYMDEELNTETQTAGKGEDSIDPAKTVSKNLGGSAGVLSTVSATKDPVVVETVESIKSPRTIEPSRKKLKKTKHDNTARQNTSGSTFTKYAATAIVGAALGAVGTIFGLAALPQDYFV